jgi:hypothetical protein
VRWSQKIGADWGFMRQPHPDPAVSICEERRSIGGGRPQVRHAARGYSFGTSAIAAPALTTLRPVTTMPINVPVSPGSDAERVAVH